MTELRFDAAARSETGRERPNNEDAYLVSNGLVAVADGVGGRPAGEVASRLAVNVFAELVTAGADPGEAVQATSRLVRTAGKANSLLTGMCSTLTAAIMTADAVHVAHVGDSHAWLVREGAVTLVSEDQSIAAALVRAGELTEEAAAGDPRRHTLTQAIGSVRPLLPQLAALAADRGDRLVLATDGIDYVDADLLAVLLAKPLPAVELADRLVEAAYDVGAPDNVTVVVADVG